MVTELCELEKARTLVDTRCSILLAGGIAGLKKKLLAVSSKAVPDQSSLINDGAIRMREVPQGFWLPSAAPTQVFYDDECLNLETLIEFYKRPFLFIRGLAVDLCRNAGSVE